MNNTLENLYRKITNDLTPVPSISKMEGLVSNIQIQKNSLVDITLLTEPIPDCNAICQTEELFEKALGTEEVCISVFSEEAEQIDVIPYLPWAFRHIEKRDFLLGSFLRTAAFEKVSSDHIHFSIHQGCEEVFENNVEQLLSDFFLKALRIPIQFSQQVCAVNLEEAVQETRKKAIEIAVQQSNQFENTTEKQPAKKDPSNGNGKPAESRKTGGSGENPNQPPKLGAVPRNTEAAPAAGNQQSQRYAAKDYKKMKQPDGVIWGRMNTKLTLVPMNTLTNETGPAMMEGQVFGVESRPVSNGTKILIKFCLTDQTNSIRCFAFMKPDEAADFEESYKKAYLRICAEVTYDAQFEKDLVAKIIGIQIANPPKKKGDNASEKRVELHCHTKMSSKDSVCEVADIVKLAAQYGHEAVAITDHGVVQAFPDARTAQLDVKKKGKQIKIIYGMECYLVEDGPVSAFSCNADSLNRGFVAINLITTGENPASDRILEIGAILYEKNDRGEFAQTDRFHAFLNPGREITGDEETFSGLTADQVREGGVPLHVLTELESFIGNRPLVAHDVLYYTAFLRYEGFRTENESDPRVKFFQPAIDTLRIARIFYPEIPDFKPETIRNELSLKTVPDGSIFDSANFAAEFFITVMKVKNIVNPEELNHLSGMIPDETLLADSSKRQYHCIILSQDYVGLYGIYRIVSESHLRYIYKERPRIPRRYLEFYRSGNLFGSACEAGELFIQVMDHYEKNDTDYHQSVRSLLSSDLPRIASFYDYLEIQPVGNNNFMLRTTEKKGQIIPSHYQSVEDLRNLNRLVVDLGSMLGKPVCATCDVHFLQPSDAVYREIMQADMGFSDAAMQAPLFFRTTDEMLKEFEYLGEDLARKIVIETPKEIAGKIQPDMKPFPEGTFPPVIATAAHDIDELTWATARQLYEYKGELPEIVKSRIEKELKSIIGNGFAIMYYIAHKLVKKSNDDGYIVGSRGSVGSSFVATLCGITEVNPLAPHYRCPQCRHSEFNLTGEYGSGYDMEAKQCPDCGTWMIRDGQDIPFETFLGFDGDKQPDIDLNFSGENQPAAHKFIEEMFGSSHTFRAGTISGYAEKNAISMVQKYCSNKDVFMTKAETLRLANGLIGVKRTTGQHPGGIVVVPKERDVYDFTPVQCPADKTDIGIITTHFDFNSLHDTILKLDILGHDDPTMLKVLGDMTGIDVRTIPIPDDQVMKLFLSNEPLKLILPCSTDSGTLGLPELGTFMARGMIKDTKPTRFYDLVQLMGLSHGTDVWKGNAQDLIKNGTCTISEVIGCRDSIMTSLIYWNLPPKSAFTIMEKVRKGKGLTEEQENLMREKGVPEWYIDSCKKIKYMFPKAHAAAYSISALRIAWFKVYYKAEYYCAFFTVRADEFDARIMCKGFDAIKHYRDKLSVSFRAKEKLLVKVLGKEEEFSPEKANKIYYILELIEEMYCRGVEFLPVDIYESDATHFKKISDTRIRPPLNTLPSLSDAIAANIVEARKQVDQFLSREDFARRAGVGETLMQLLDAQGCLEGMPATTQIDIFSLF